MRYRSGGKLDHGLYYAGNSFWDAITQQQVIFGWLLEDDLDDRLRQQQGWAGVISLPRFLKLYTLRSVIGTISSPLNTIGSIEMLPENPDGTQFTIVGLCAVPDRRLRRSRGCLLLLDPKLDSTMLFPELLAQWEMDLTLSVCDDAKTLGFDIVHSSCKSTALDNQRHTNNSLKAEHTGVYFEPDSESIIIDRSHSSTHPGIRTCQEQAPHTLFKFAHPNEKSQSADEFVIEHLRFQVLYDCSVLQIFVNERTAVTTRVYPASGTSTGIRIFVERKQPDTSHSRESRILSCVLWPLSPPR